MWKATAGTPEDLTLLTAAGVAPRIEALRAMPEAPFPLAPDDAQARVANGKVALRFPLAADEEVYGLGVDFKSMRRTGSTFQLHVDHWGGRTGRTHAPVPFYVSTRGYGVFIDTARYVTVNVGVGVRLAAPVKPPVIDRTTGGEAWSANPRSDSIEALVPAAGVDVYVFAGPTLMDAVRRYNLFGGGGALAAEVGPRVHDAHADRRTPPNKSSTRSPSSGSAASRSTCSAWSRAGTTTPTRPRSSGRRRGFPTRRRFSPSSSGCTCARTCGSTRTCRRPRRSTRSCCRLPARTSCGTASCRTTRCRRRGGSSRITCARRSSACRRALGGFKVDEVDGFDHWLWPDLATFPSGHDGEQLRQTYGLLVQRLLMDLYRGLNRRTLGQVRGTNGGASSFPFVIYNDNYAFDEYITAVGNSAFAGVLWSPEVRGGEGEDMLRRIQAVCFSPLALFNGWATATKLWTHAEVADDIRDAITLRMRLLPYWYTTFAQYRDEGTPVIRPMPLVPGVDAAGADVKDQYMIGDALLVAPIAPGAKARTVVLPAGKWFDFYTGRLAGEGQTITVTPPLSQIPLFVKDGGLVPMIGERQYAPGRRRGVAAGSAALRRPARTLAALRRRRRDLRLRARRATWTRLAATRDAARRLDRAGHARSQRQALALLGGLLDVHDAEPLDAPATRKRPGLLHTIGDELFQHRLVDVRQLS